MNNKSPECWSTDPQAHGLRVEVATDRSLILPFEHFAYSEFKTGGESETLKLVFATHEILLRGQALRRVEAAVQRMELSFVAAVPDRFRTLMPEGQPFIAEIEVTSSAPPESASQGEPRAEGGLINGNSD